MIKKLYIAITSVVAIALLINGLEIFSSYPTQAIVEIAPDLAEVRDNLGDLKIFKGIEMQILILMPVIDKIYHK